MKIGIITIVEGNNYGNVLQNYALQKALEKLHYYSETINKCSLWSSNRMCGKIDQYMRMLVKLVIKKKSNLPIIRRQKAFDIFRKEHIRYSSFYVGGNTFPKRHEQDYEYYIFGSDQIWNPCFRIIDEGKDVFWGRFTRKSKKIAYAASFGVESIPNEWHEYVQNALVDFRNIGVREESGQKIVKGLVGLEAPLLPDPTLLLTPEEWGAIEKKPNIFSSDKQFIVTYFLNSYDQSFWDEIQKYARNTGKDVINLNNGFINCKNTKDLEYYACSPAEFVWLIHNSDCVITDSFHGSVFSLLFRKPFHVLPRSGPERGNNMVSRIDTLLKIFQESNRLNAKINWENLSSTIDEKKIFDVQEKLRNIGGAFLQDSLVQKESTL